MQKPLRFKPEGGLRKNSITRILPQTPQNGNSANNKCQIFTFIEQRRLTDALEYLENYGYTGDAAINMIRYLQIEGAA